MKLIALAAALALGGTAIAQETPQTTPPADTTGQDMQPTTPPSTTSSTTTTTTTQTTTGTTGAGTATDPATTAPATTAAPAAASAADPRGGYMPSGSPFSTGTPPVPGQQVTVQASPDPNVAFPPPAPLKKYPPCKRGQFDDCMQRGGR